MKKERLFFIDNIRVFLTISVVIFHFAVIYQGEILLFYSDPTDNQIANVALIFIKLINQAYFMGLFFFISGYFTPSSLKRKGVKAFIKERLVNFGIPFLAYFFILGPLTMILLSWMPSHMTGITETVTYSRYFTDKTFEAVWLGQLWFVLMLLLFNICYALCKTWAKNSGKEQKPYGNLPGLLSICLFTLAITVLCFIVMIFIPVGHYVLGFPTLAYLPQYIAFFAVGTIAGQNDWLRTLPSHYGKKGIVVAVLSSVTMLPLTIYNALNNGIIAMGTGTWNSAVFYRQTVLGFMYCT